MLQYCLSSRTPYPDLNLGFKMGFSGICTERSEAFNQSEDVGCSV